MYTPAPLMHMHKLACSKIKTKSSRYLGLHTLPCSKAQLKKHEPINQVR